MSCRLRAQLTQQRITFSTEHVRLNISSVDLLAGRWRGHAPSTVINATDDELRLTVDTLGNHLPTLLEGLRVDRFEITFKVNRVTGSDHAMRLIFNATDQNDYDLIELYHRDTQQAPHGWEVIDGAYAVVVTETSTDANMPTLTSGSDLWVRITNDATTVTVKCATTEAGLTSATACYTSTDFDTSGGGMIGFASARAVNSVDDLTVKADRDANGSYEVTEHKDGFTLDGSGYDDSEPTHDAAGNLTWDGIFSYTYDAWNRLVTTTKAYQDPDNSYAVTDGSDIASYSYDAVGRRIIHTVQNAGPLDMTYHDYWTGQGWSLIEQRNGSDQVIRQFVWSLEYIDSLVQVALNVDPADGAEDVCESLYYATHDLQFNVLGLVDDTGTLAERYSYTPYGQRTVHFSHGSDDDLLQSPTGMSRRWMVSSTDQPYGLNPVGHQGLRHDADTTLVYNRARRFNPTVMRFLQRDPLGRQAAVVDYRNIGSAASNNINTLHTAPDVQYLDSRSLYESRQSLPIIHRDPTGLYTLANARKALCHDQCVAVPNHTVEQYLECIAECGDSLPDETVYTKWLSLERASTAWLAKVPKCPSKIRLCRRRHSVWGKQCTVGEFRGATISRASEEYHPGAFFEMRSRNWSGPGAQCTYDAVGDLITGFGLDSGSADRETASWVNVGSHFAHDVEPWRLAQQLDGWTGAGVRPYGQHTDDYYSVRPPPTGGGKCY